MYPPADGRIRLLLIVVGIGAFVFAVRWIISLTVSPDRELIDLLSLLVRVQLTSTLLANALAFAAVIFASAIIPFTVVWALRRQEQQGQNPAGEEPKAPLPSQPAPKPVENGGARPVLPSGTPPDSSQHASPKKIGDLQPKK